MSDHDNPNIAAPRHLVPGHMPDLYFYRAVIRRWVDADTVDVRLDFGFTLTRDLRFRLYRINAWETRGPQRPKGLEAKAYVEALAPAGTVVLLRTHKDESGKFGRPLADVHLLPDLRCVNDALVEEGHAVHKDYR